MLPIGGFYTIDPPKAAVLANYISPHTVVPLHYGSLLGGKCAPDKFRAALRADITADIRPNVPPVALRTSTNSVIHAA